MRAIRALAVVALVSLDLSTAAAQSTRHFKDSWFWGVKGCAMLYQVQSQTTVPTIAPTAGIDWLITRTNGGLYVSFDESLFNEFVFVNDSLSPLDVTPRQVDLKNMHRFTLAGMLFPMQTYRMHPYIGFGFALASIATANPQGTFRNGTQQRLVTSTIQQFKTAGAPVVILGTQLRTLFGSFFVHANATPSNSNFFLYTGPGWRITAEAGVRYNTGSSVDRMR
jgi:hypothetical protein